MSDTVDFGENFVEWERECAVLISVIFRGSARAAVASWELIVCRAVFVFFFVQNQEESKSYLCFSCKLIVVSEFIANFEASNHAVPLHLYR